jgi:hypothetical protein
MTQNPSVKRHLKDPHLDRIDHALGRPLDPMRETFRNHYAVGANSAVAAALQSSEHWQSGAQLGPLVVFHVLPSGRAALRDYLCEIAETPIEEAQP